MSEWIDKKIKERDVNYFEYDKFSSIVEVGKGGFGRVSRAYLANKGLYVALKSFDGNSKNEEDILEFIKELKLLRRVYYHENINSFLGITKNPIGNYIMVLEYANEGNLRDYLENKFNLLEWKDKIQMALDITCGLICLHSEEIIHRDLHSKNILVNNGKLLIADFGLSKELAEAASNSSNSAANKLGIVEYIEPQCFKIINYKKDKKSDIYSLGVLLWEISSGHPPFLGYPRSVLGSHIGYINLREKPIKDTPLVYQQLYQKCWDDKPDSRPDIEEVHRILIKLKIEEFSNSLSITSQPRIRENGDNDGDSRQPDLIIPTEMDIEVTSLETTDPNNQLKTRNLLIVGYVGSGKSTLSNVLSDTVNFEESKYSINKTKNFQTQIFEWEGTKYHIVDTIGNIKLNKKKVMYEKLAEIIYLMPEGISQVLFVIDGNFTVEESSVFNLLKDVIFESGISEYITIVRTKFSNFKNESECQKDKEDLCNKNETIAKLYKSGKSIVYLDNPSINISVIDDDDDKTNEINKRKREQSRYILLKHLDKVFRKNYYKLRFWDKLHSKIYTGNIVEEVERNLKLEFPTLNFNHSEKEEHSNSIEKVFIYAYNNLIKNFNQSINLKGGMKENIRSLIIVGRTNSGKSTLANVLNDSYYFEESVSAARKTETKYHVVDTGTTKLTKNIIKLSKGASQFLFVIDGKFTKEELDAIFDSGINENITIVRTKFSNFKNENECEKDKKSLCKQNETIAKLCKSIIYVDNPPINISVIDDDDDKTNVINEKKRRQSRDILLKYLEKVFQEKKNTKSYYDCS